MVKVLDYIFRFILLDLYFIYLSLAVCCYNNEIKYAAGYNPPLLSVGHTMMDRFINDKGLMFLYFINTTLLVGVYQGKTS